MSLEEFRPEEELDSDVRREENLLSLTSEALNERIRDKTDAEEIQREVDGWAKLCNLIKIEAQHIALLFELDMEDAEDFMFWLYQWEHLSDKEYGCIGLYYSPKTKRFIRVNCIIEHGAKSYSYITYHSISRELLKWYVEDTLEEFV